MKFQVNILKKIDGIIIVIDIDVIGQLALLRSMMEFEKMKCAISIQLNRETHEI